MERRGTIAIECPQEYASELVATLHSLRRDESLTDFTIKVKGGYKLRCHKLVLALHSPVMRRMLTSDMSEANSDCVEYNWIDKAIMEILLDYMYSLGTVHLFIYQLLDTIHASRYFELTNLDQQCLQKCLPKIHPVNVILMYTKARKYRLTEVEEACEEMIAVKLEEIKKQLDFKKLEYSVLKNCFDKIKHKTKRTLLVDAALYWVSLDAGCRYVMMEDLVGVKCTAVKARNVPS